jgi:predicted transcriptional regulator
MNENKIRAIKLLKGGSLTINELAKSLGLSYSRTASIVRELLSDKYCEKDRGRITLASNAKTILLRKISEKYDLNSLLRGAAEQLLLTILSKPMNVHEIQSHTGLAQSTVYQSIRRLLAVGAIRRIGKKYTAVEDRDLQTFLNLLNQEKISADVEPYAILIKSNGYKLKKVPVGKEAKGSLTAFSLFSKYGVAYSSPHDYFIDPPREVSIEDVLIHALACSETKAERTMCAVFYLKNRNKIDFTRAKIVAKEFDVLHLWLDLQNYVNGAPISKVDSFLPWDEFVEKAGVYGLKVSPPPAENVFAALTQIGKKLGSEIRAYLFGGGNLLMRGLKKATEDLDIVVEDEMSFSQLHSALLLAGYRPIAEHEMTLSEKRLNPSNIYVAENLPRIDLFTKVICNAFALTDEMKKRSKAIAFGKLIVNLLSLEDVLLLKAITEREGDIEDMATIIRQTGAIDWDVLERTYFEEEKLSKRHFCFVMLDNFEIIEQREGIVVPFHKILLRHCLDVGILQALAEGAKTIAELRKLIDFPEHRLRNRIKGLLNQGKISKSKTGKRLRFSLTEKGKSSLFL